MKTGAEDFCALNTKAYCSELNAEIEIKNLKSLSKMVIGNVQSDVFSSNQLN